MAGSYVMSAGANFEPDRGEPIMESIFKQYEHVLIESLVSAFGLDFFVRDQHGGDVDTIHNVRKIGQDEQMTYKNQANQRAYEQRGDYNSSEYHKNSQYIAKNREVSEQKKNGILIDSYTGEKIERNGKSDLDHVVSAKEIHDDRGRVLAGLSGVDLANSDENLHATNPHTNRTKKADSMTEFLDKYGDEYTEEQKANMRRKDAAARKAYEARLAKAYYTSPRFAKDMMLAAGTVSLRLGARQAVGFVFAEMWFSVKEEFQNIRGRFDLGEFLETLGRGITRGFERAKEKYAELFSRFLNGAVAGALSSLTTTLCNIFFTTAKNVVRIIRQSYVSLVEAGKVLFINPDNYAFGDRMKAVVKILATGASVVVGVIVSEAVGKTPIGTIPVLGEVIQTFCGAFVTGIMSCTLLYFFDRSEMMQKVFGVLNSLHTIETEVNYYRQQAAYFERYAAELMNIDIEQYKKEAAQYGSIADKLENAQTENELNYVLKQAFCEVGIVTPWKGYDSFDEFMEDKDSCLVFE